MPAAPLAFDPPPHSIAVLPFMDMSEKHDQGYFSDGLSEELIDLLSRTPDLRVIARTSSFQFKGRNKDVRSVARQLGVANLLEGSVRKSGATMRVTVQLIKAADGSHVWSETYERRLDDIFKVQDDICGTVVKALKLELNPRLGRRAGTIRAGALTARGRRCGWPRSRSPSAVRGVDRPVAAGVAARIFMADAPIFV